MNCFDLCECEDWGGVSECGLEGLLFLNVGKVGSFECGLDTFLCVSVSIGCSIWVCISGDTRVFTLRSC